MSDQVPARALTSPSASPPRYATAAAWLSVAAALLGPTQVRIALYQTPSATDDPSELLRALGLYLGQITLSVAFFCGFALFLRSVGVLRPGFASRLMGSLAVGAVVGMAGSLLLGLVWGRSSTEMGSSLLAGLSAGLTLFGWGAAINEPRPREEVTVRSAWWATGMAGALALSSLLLLEGAWSLLSHQVAGAALLSWLCGVLSIHHLILCAFLLAYVLDDVTVHRTCRWVCGLLLLGTAASTLGDSWPGWDREPAPPDAGGSWEEAVWRRMDLIDQHCEGPYLLVAASGGGSRAAATATLMLGTLHREGQGRCTAHDRILFASGVSGGSLALAHDVFDPHPPLTEVSSWRSGYVGEIRGRLPPPLREGWWMRSRRVDEMFLDFGAPVLRGIIEPWTTRGAALSRYWQQTFGWQQDRDDQDPILMLNTTDAATGVRVILGFPPVPADLLIERKMYATGGPVAVAHDQPVAAALAVRASSAFPFGLDAPVIDGQKLIDGGMFDNTGLDAIGAVFEGLAQRAQTESGERGAKELLDRIRSRGIILVEVDAGARPAPSGRWQRILDEITTPAYALRIVAYPREHLLREFNRNRLCKALRGDERVARGSYLVTHDEPDGSGTGTQRPVVTTWGLSSADIARVIETYAHSSFDEELHHAILAMQSPASELPDPRQYTLCGGRATASEMQP